MHIKLKLKKWAFSGYIVWYKLLWITCIKIHMKNMSAYFLRLFFTWKRSCKQIRMVHSFIKSCQIWSIHVKFCHILSNLIHRYSYTDLKRFSNLSRSSLVWNLTVGGDHQVYWRNISYACTFSLLDSNHPGGVNHMIIDWLPIDTSEKNTTITQLSLTACLTEFHPKSCTSHSSKRRDSSDISI